MSAFKTENNDWFSKNTRFDTWILCQRRENNDYLRRLWLTTWIWFCDWVPWLEHDGFSGPMITYNNNLCLDRMIRTFILQVNLLSLGLYLRMGTKWTHGQGCLQLKKMNSWSGLLTAQKNELMVRADYSSKPIHDGIAHDWAFKSKKWWPNGDGNTMIDWVFPFSYRNMMRWL